MDSVQELQHTSTSVSDTTHLIYAVYQERGSAAEKAVTNTAAGNGTPCENSQIGREKGK